MNETYVLQRLQTLDSSLYERARQIQKAAAAKLARIVEVFPHYTCHDITHSLAVLDIVEWLAGHELIDNLNGPELFALAAGVMVHDLGMTVSPEERMKIEGDPDYRKFAEESALAPAEALAEWIRRQHHHRSADIIRTSHNDATGIPIDDSGLAHVIALLCETHGERDLDNFEKYDPFFAWRSGISIRVPLLGVLLRLGDLLHVTSDRTPLAVIPLVSLSTAKSRTEWNRHLSTVGVARTSGSSIRITCLCKDPGVHREVLRLCDYINEEFRYCNKILGALSRETKKTHALACCEIRPNITPKGYIPWTDLQFSLDREGLLELLVGARIYRGPSAVVRELLMNAVDACRQRAKLEQCSPVVRIELDTTKNLLRVEDDGIGMDEGDLRDFFLRLGRCFYRSSEYRSRYTSQEQIQSVSEFGIGFGSCFLAADHVTLDTLRAGQEPIFLDMYGLLDFAAARPGSRTASGTIVTLHLKSDAIKEIKGVVGKIHELCPHVEAPIEVTTDGNIQVVMTQPYRTTADSMLLPFFRMRSPEFIVKHHQLTMGEHQATGYISLQCVEKDGVLIPSGVFYYRLDHTKEMARRFSQLGFALPKLSNYPYILLANLNLSSWGFDIDLRGDFCLELNTARTEVLPSPHTQEILQSLDKELVTFIESLHKQHWRNLDREEKFIAYESLGHMLIGRLKLVSLAPPDCAIHRLVDLLFENMPLEVISPDGKTERFSWNEVRARATSVLFYPKYRARDEQNHQAALEELAKLLPDCMIIVDNPSYNYLGFFDRSCSLKAFCIADSIRMGFEVFTPESGTAAELAASTLQVRPEPLDFILSFIPTSPYATVSRKATHRGGAISRYVNREHPKIQAMLGAARKAERSNQKVPQTIEFLMFLHNEALAAPRDPEYVAYIAAHQEKALIELVHLGVLEQEKKQDLLLDMGDYVPWENDW